MRETSKNVKELSEAKGLLPKFHLLLLSLEHTREMFEIDVLGYLQSIFVPQVRCKKILLNIYQVIKCNIYS